MQHNNDSKFLHQINVTPFIDVMLVLLVIFMMASSAMVADLQVNIPESSTAQARSSIDNTMLSINILKSGMVMVQSKLMNDDDLIKTIIKFKKNNEKVTVIINADSDVIYSKIVAVMDTLRKNGINRVSLATKGAT